MERHPRRTVELEISPALSAALGALRATTQTRAAPDLDVDRVRDVEAGVGSRLPDPLLAVLAAGLGFLRDDLSAELKTIMSHTARARESKARGDFVAFGLDKTSGRFHGFVIGADDDQIAIFDDKGRSRGSQECAAWLVDRAIAAGVDPTQDAAPCTPRVVRAARPEPEGARVRHKLWGIGRVLTDQGSGPKRKVKAAFPDLGVKTVNGRFLDFLDEQDE